MNILRAISVLIAKKKNVNENESKSEVKKLKLRKLIDNEGNRKWELIKYFINPRLSAPVLDQLENIYEVILLQKFL